MKDELILAYKKKLSTVARLDDMKFDSSLAKTWGGYSTVEFDKFCLSQMMGVNRLRYNKTRVELTDDEWSELNQLSLDRKKVLEDMEVKNDYNEIMNIING
jgi:uncharacterized alpha-E superfamily protein